MALLLSKSQSHEYSKFPEKERDRETQEYRKKKTKQKQKKGQNLEVCKVHEGFRNRSKKSGRKIKIKRNQT